MTRRKTLGAGDLIKKINEAEAWWKEDTLMGNNVAASRSTYDNAIHGGIGYICTGEASDALKLRVASALPDYFAFRIRNGTTIETAHEDEILKLLLSEPLLECCLAQPAGERNLAWFCVQRAQGFEQYNLLDYEELLSKFLMAWLELKTPDTGKNKMVEIAGLVYGGHINTLEILGYVDNPNLPHELWVANQAVFKPSNRKRTDLTEHVLPNDMSV